MAVLTLLVTSITFSGLCSEDCKGSVHIPGFPGPLGVLGLRGHKSMQRSLRIVVERRSLHAMKHRYLGKQTYSNSQVLVVGRSSTLLGFYDSCTSSLVD